jgi:hypothetical protein
MNIKYVYQKNEIKNGADYCGASCVSMITGENPQRVADIVGASADDTTLTNYLLKKGFKISKIIDGGSEKTGWGFIPSDADFDKMKHILADSEGVILYHFAGWDKKSAGHYVVCTGYDEEENKFSFNDPAGDRSEGYFNIYGEGAEYTPEQLQKAGAKRSFYISEV